MAGLLCGVLMLAACGFRPVYDGNGGTVRAVHSVTIAPIPDRDGQVLRNALIDRLNPRGQPDSPRYRLDVHFSESLNRLAVARDDSLVRGQIAINATFSLVALADGSVALTGRSRALNSYNVVDRQLASVVTERDARERALAEVAEDIATKLALFIDRPL
jgi:LPS-assembly lipoprotein